MAVALLQRQPLANRLWQGGGIVLCVLLAILVMNFALPVEKSVGRAMLGHDFLAFYTAGSFVNSGRADQLYDLEAVRRFQKQVAARESLEVGEGFGPFWNPPFYAWVFAPLARLPYSSAVVVWTAINALAAAGAIALLCSFVRNASHPWKRFGGDCGDTSAWKFWLLVPLLVCCSMPFIQALSHGQNTCISLLILTAAVALWRGNRALLAGMVGGLLFYKPQLGAVFAAAMALWLGWRAILGLGITGVALLAINELTLPGSLSVYLSQLPRNIATFQIDNPYLWERHVTLKAFWRLLIQGHAIGPMSMMGTVLWLGSCAAVVAGLVVALGRCRVRAADDVFSPAGTSGDRRDRFIAATILAMPLLMPFYFDYDLLLLAVPFTLIAAERLRGGGRDGAGEDRAVVALSAVMFLWLMVNPGLAREGSLNVSVILLALIAAMSIRRACALPAAVVDAPGRVTHRPELRAVVPFRRAA